MNKQRKRESLDEERNGLQAITQVWCLVLCVIYGEGTCRQNTTGRLLQQRHKLEQCDNICI
jgi:hypothetical protein